MSTAGARLQRRAAERELDDSFGGRLYAAAARDAGLAAREWAHMLVWADVGEHDYRCGILTGVETRTRRLLLRDNTDRIEHRAIPKNVFPANPTLLSDATDLATLSHINDACVLYTLKKRYTAQRIYTASGPLIIAVNPYVRVHVDRAPDEPHAHAIAEQAYRALNVLEQNQSILVTGESGAGKTETTKILLAYFASKGRSATGLERKVLSTTPIFESFGNAKTLRNDNSSRFGKFILMEFDATGAVAGAQLRTYLLEKARLTHHGAGERGYHIFYELLAYCATERAAFASQRKWKLGKPGDYQYLATDIAGPLDIDGVGDAERFRVTLDALRSVGTDDATIDRVCSLLVALLALGNVVFENSPGDEARLVESNRDWLGEASVLLGITKPVLLDCLTVRRIKAVREAAIVKTVNATQAGVARDSLAVFLYTWLFAWLVKRVNASVSATKTEGLPARFIGILDIYGFETFAVNSFEQFCINYANEKLQHQFNQYMFKVEQDEYEREGIDVSRVSFSDNSGCIRHIEGPHGILDLLNEETRLNGNADNLPIRIARATVPPGYTLDDKLRPGNEFGVRHYPGVVTYNASAFIEKNRNAAPIEFLTLLSDNTSGSALVRDVCAEFEAHRTHMTTTKRDTLATQFKESLAELMTTIASTQPNYIRCVKPNDGKVPFLVEPGRVLEQLRCGGVMEATRIAQAGFPTRVPYRTFGLRYLVLGPHGARATLMGQLGVTVSLARDAVRTLLAHCAISHPRIALPDACQYGKTKLFLKAGMLAQMEQLLATTQFNAAAVLQSHIRKLAASRRFDIIRKGLVALEALARMKVGRHCLREHRLLKAALVMQRSARGTLCRSDMSRRKSENECSIVLQSHVRAWNARQKLKALGSTSPRNVITNTVPPVPTLKPVPLVTPRIDTEMLLAVSTSAVRNAHRRAESEAQLASKAISGLEARIDNLKRELVESEERLKVSETSSYEHESLARRATAELSEVRAASAEREIVEHGLAHRIQQLTSECQALTQANAEVEERSNRVNKACQEWMDEAKALRETGATERASHSSQLGAMNAALSSLRDELTRVREVQSEKAGEPRPSDLEKEIQVLKIREDKVAAYSSGLRKANQELSSRSAALEKAIEEARRAASEAASETCRAKKAAEDATERATALQTQLDALKKNGSARSVQPEQRKSEDAEALFDATVLARVHHDTSAAARFVVRHVVSYFLEHERESSTSQSTPSAAIILARWLLRNRLAWDTMALITIAGALLESAEDASLEATAWLFKTAAALYTLVRTEGSRPGTTPALTLWMDWKATKKSARAKACIPEGCIVSVTLASELQIALVTMFGRLAWPPVQRARNDMRRLVKTLCTPSTNVTMESTAAAITELLIPFAELVVAVQRHCLHPLVIQQLLHMLVDACDSAVFNLLMSTKGSSRTVTSRDALTRLGWLINITAQHLRVILSGTGPAPQLDDTEPAALFPYTIQLLSVIACPKLQLFADNMCANLAPDLDVNQVWRACDQCQRETNSVSPATHAMLATLDYDANEEVLLDETRFDIETLDVHILRAADAKAHTPDRGLLERIVRGLNGPA